MLTVGSIYRVKTDHPYFGGQEGYFEFMGGPNCDVVVLNRIPVHPRYSAYICVDEKDIEKTLDTPATG